MREGGEKSAKRREKCHNRSKKRISYTTENRGYKEVRDYIRQRILEEARYIAETKSTVRHTATVFLSSKSTVHKDVTERLKEIDKDLCEAVRQVLELNLSERHIRGGLATRKKYLKKKNDGR